MMVLDGYLEGTRREIFERKEAGLEYDMGQQGVARESISKMGKSGV